MTRGDDEVALLHDVKQNVAFVTDGVCMVINQVGPFLPCECRVQFNSTLNNLVRHEDFQLSIWNCS